MMGWLKRAIAWAVAGDDLAELSRWRLESKEMRRWMAEFPDVCTALDHIERFATGLTYRGLTEVREAMRNRRDAHPALFELTLSRDLTPGEVDEFKHLWRGATNLRTAPLAELESATDWDVATQYVRDFQEFIDEDFERTHAAIMADPPTHFTGLFPPAPRRVAYKFLSPGCEARS
jgi:hypothetical protein